MALVHDAYLFDLESFAKAIAPNVMNFTAASFYSQLRAEAIHLYESNNLTQALLSDYGGWDKSAFLEIPETLPTESDNIAFWFIIWLYSEFKSGLHEIGLGNRWRILQSILSDLGWSDSEIMLLVKGKPFGEYVQERFYSSTKLPDYWENFKPFSTASSLGWLGHVETEALLDKLNGDKHKFSGLKSHDDGNFIEAYQSAQTMLSWAKERKLDLCLIISG